MKLEPCPFCGSDDVEMLHHTGGYVTCYKCESSGPIYDALGEKWNSAQRNVPATLETSESGPMPWRLQIAAMLLAHRPEDFTRKEAFVTADILICEHNESAPKEVQP